MKDNNREKKKTAVATILFIAGVFAVLFAAFFIRHMTGFGQGGTGEYGGENQAGTELSGESALFLLINETDYITGSESRAEVAVLYTDKICGEIMILDEDGREICEIENDGSGYGEGGFCVPSDHDGCIRYQAVSGNHRSNQVTCYIHPEITEEMVRMLAEVSSSLEDFVTEQNFEDPLGSEALGKVREYLLSDDRVAAAWENEGAVLYATTDSLMGSYGLGAFDETRFGGSFSDAEDTYRSFAADQDVSQRTLQSMEVLTNTKVLHLSPLPEDRLVRTVKESYNRKISQLADAVGGRRWGMARICD